jgi:2,5-furandicarboxylate decarboxylase 1
MSRLLESKRLKVVSDPLSSDLDISCVLNSFQGQAFLFEKVINSSLRVAGNLYGNVGNLKIGLGLSDEDDITKFTMSALNSPSPSKGQVSICKKETWEIDAPADLSKLPILTHYDREAGKYLTAGMVAVKYPGSEEENLSFHRMLVLSRNKLAARIVPRHLDQVAKEAKGHKVPLVIVIGPPPAVFLSASLQTTYGLSEYRIANKMMNEKLDLVSSASSGICYPKDSEIVLEGYLDYEEKTPEGPFVDLTGTYDDTREQPVVTIEEMHYNSDSIYQGVLAGSLEHSFFMGLPQEIKIRDALSKTIPHVRGVNLTPAGNGYFHCVASIQKGNDGDGKTAILNCFSASHPLKLVVVVDSDVDPFNLSEVEWALATRFQADRGVVQINGAKGSSLDPSSGKSGVTAKLGLDATLPIKTDVSKFEKAAITAGERAQYVIRSLRKQIT